MAAAEHDFSADGACTVCKIDYTDWVLYGNPTDCVCTIIQNGSGSLMAANLMLDANEKTR